MAYFAISTGSLVRALNRNGMMMSVFTSLGQTQVRPRMIVDGGGRLIGISWDRQYVLPVPMRRLLREMRGRFWLLWRPFVPHSSVGKWRDRFHSPRERRGEFRRMHRMWRWRTLLPIQETFPLDHRGLLSRTRLWRRVWLCSGSGPSFCAL